MIGIESVETAGIHECSKIGVLHFLDLTAGGADQVGVGQGDALILGLHPLKHMSPEHLGLDEQLDGVSVQSHGTNS